MRVYLVRHPQPEVAAGICYGSTDLAVAAHERANVLSALTEVLPKNAPVFSSPLRRCAELAEDLAAMLGCAEVIHDARLVEMHFGEWEMRAWDEIPRTEFDAWINELATHRPGGGESLIDMAQRIHSFHDDLRQRQVEHAVVVCHAGTIRLLRACRPDLRLADLARAAAEGNHKIGFGELLVLDW
jgi:alpha-ribazole phosphatase